MTPNRIVTDGPKITISTGQALFWVCIGILLQLSVNLLFVFAVGGLPRLATWFPPPSVSAEAVSQPSQTAAAASVAMPTQAPRSEPLASSVAPRRAKEIPVSIQPGANETYLQVGASPLEQAQAFAVSLQSVGFPAKLGPGPSAQIYRVLVGPLPDPYALAHTRDLLRRAGYDSLVRRYGKEDDQ